MSFDIQGQLVSYHADRPPEPRIQVKITNPSNGRHVLTHMLIDTGASISVLPAEMFDILGFDVTTMKKVDRNTAGGIKTAYVALVDIEIGGETSSIEMDFTLGWKVPVIGYNLLSECVFSISYVNENFSLSKK